MKDAEIVEMVKHQYPELYEDLMSRVTMIDSINHQQEINLFMLLLAASIGYNIFENENGLEDGLTKYILENEHRLLISSL